MKFPFLTAAWALIRERLEAYLPLFVMGILLVAGAYLISKNKSSQESEENRKDALIDSLQRELSKRDSLNYGFENDTIEYLIYHTTKIDTDGLGG